MIQAEWPQDLRGPGARRDDDLVRFDQAPVAANTPRSPVSQFERHMIVTENGARRDGRTGHSGGEQPAVHTGTTGNVDAVEFLAQRREELFRFGGRHAPHVPSLGRIGDPGPDPLLGGVQFRPVFGHDQRANAPVSEIRFSAPRQPLDQIRVVARSGRIESIPLRIGDLRGPRTDNPRPCQGRLTLVDLVNHFDVNAAHGKLIGNTGSENPCADHDNTHLQAPHEGNEPCADF